MSILTTMTRMWLTRTGKPFTFTNEYDSVLPYANTSSLGLYFHIPFCRNLCSFCPYCKVLYDKELCDEYIDALIQEIHIVGSQMKEKKKCTSLYFGGGSPALVADRLKEIIAAIDEHFIVTDGMGIELHPEDVTIGTLTKLKEAGISKISIGIQSFQREFLTLLGRGETDYTEMIQAIQTIAFDTVSMDLIFALPGQTLANLTSDIDQAFALGANHVATYPFIDFSFADSGIMKVNKKEKRRLLDGLTQHCAQHGYRRDSIWTFAKDSKASYSSMTRDNFLGFGCSATTLLMDQFKINTFSVEEYISRIGTGNLPTSLTIRFVGQQRMVYYLFWTAYSTKINSDDFEQFFNVTLKKRYGLELWLAEGLGFLTKENNTFRMTPKGAFFYHYYENYYTLAYIDKMWGILKEEAFPEKIIL